MEQVIRRDFSRSQFKRELPNLLQVQLNSMKSFLQEGISARVRDPKKGLEQIFRDIFPITDKPDDKGNYSLEYENYSFGVPKYSIKECRERGLTYSVPLRAKMHLDVFEGEGEDRKFIERISNDVFICEMPKMTEHGTFIINGAERVVVSQLHRSPGVTFDEEPHPSGKAIYRSRIIPSRGSWVEFLVDVNDVLYISIDRRKKIPATTFLRALGYSKNKDILELFYKSEKIQVREDLVEEIEERVLFEDVIDKKSGEFIAFAGQVLTADPEKIKKDKENYSYVSVYNLIEADIVEVAVIEGNVADNALIHNTMLEDKAKHNGLGERSTKRHAMEKDQEEALYDIYKLMRQNETPGFAAAKAFFERMFFVEQRYDLGEVGRYRINSRLSDQYGWVKTALESIKPTRTKQDEESILPYTYDLTEEDGIVQDKRLVMSRPDFVAIVKYMVDLFNGEGKLDDIDHLGNRRVRSVGELLGNQFAVGLTRVTRAIKERLALRDQEELTPLDLINSRTISSVVATFFGSSQLSQFMDQTNPLAEVTHKRRMSALGPGGLTRERAGFEVRDVHYTHYGRLCPIETPEGPNIGLINSLATYARVNHFGFIETPYRKVVNGVVTEEVIYLTADQEDTYRIAPASTEVLEDGTLKGDMIIIHEKGDYPVVPRSEVELMDISPKQIVSVAAGLIPFLEHDDANRALMGSNMQRQAVPLLRSESPVIGTGIEARAALDSGTCIRAKRAGTVIESDADHIVIKPTFKDDDDDNFLANEELDVYDLRKYERSNQDTCINQKPIVEIGFVVEEGQVIADGASTQDGELALGKNILIGFIPWYGYNFEDAIIISEELRKNDVFTSVHIEEFELEVRDTKRGPEELTREIPNVGEDSVSNLDDRGIIRVGAEIETGDILVGKITPKGETELSPEERLLRAIFGEKAGDVRDSSLKAPPGMKGVVIHTRVFSRKERDKKTKEQDKDTIDQIKRDMGRLIRNVEETLVNKLTPLLLDQDSGEIRSKETNELIFGAGKKLNEKILQKINFSDISADSMICADEDLNVRVRRLIDRAERKLHELHDQLDKEIDKIVRGDELKPGVLQLVKVYVAKKRHLQVGDKMAGRHGNKGVISKIVPVEDMPFTADGRPLQIILNPLGVPSRMNIGQVLEVHLGWAAKGLGFKIDRMLEKAQAETAAQLKELLVKVYGNTQQRKEIESWNDSQILEFARNLKSGIKIATPVFDGAKYEDVVHALDLAGLPKSGKARLIDGRTGEHFDTPSTIGYMYMLKLGHLVDDKIHARSIGPYSLVTQQPLGGKSQFGGQRFGEMEVWALEAYGAAYTLQELLTVKSDDVMGRSKIYEAIVKGENTPSPGIPESFNVLIKEIQALGLDIKIGGDR
jgi:DNA-directed RNA polymerase subunit beta